MLHNSKMEQRYSKLCLNSILIQWRWMKLYVWCLVHWQWHLIHPESYLSFHRQYSCYSEQSTDLWMASFHWNYYLPELDIILLNLNWVTKTITTSKCFQFPFLLKYCVILKIVIFNFNLTFSPAPPLNYHAFLYGISPLYCQVDERQMNQPLV